MKIYEEAQTDCDVFLYVPKSGESIIDLQEKFNVPAHALISDNLLDNEYIEGLTLLIDRSRGRGETLLPDEKWDMEALEEKNGKVDFYPFGSFFK